MNGKHEFDGADEIKVAIRLVGERLAAAGVEIRIAVIGGAAMNLGGFINRATTDVDIIAFGHPGAEGLELHPPIEPLPRELTAAAAAVARDFGLAPDWLNTGPATQWRHGLPPGMATRINWERTGGLWIGLAHRVDLIWFKLYAAADEHWGGRGPHFGDLVALHPTPLEIAQAREWIVAQDPSPAFTALLAQVIAELTNEAR